MTIDLERLRAINYTRMFLEYILTGKSLKLKELQDDARRLLRHYPEPWWVSARCEELEKDESAKS